MSEISKRSGKFSIGFDLNLEAHDVMTDPWCCLSCNSKFTFGDCKTKS